MNYQHGYHAGSAADVFKHVVLTLLLQALGKKDKAFCYLDSHAGSACYDLQSKEAEATGEYRKGISKLWQESQLPAALKSYLQIVQQVNQLDFAQPGKPSSAGKIKNTSKGLRYYPGSPLIAQYLLRPQDRMLLSELNATAFAALKSLFAANRQVMAFQQEGYQSLKALLPPEERRGLVLIDPPYEEATELMTLPQKIQTFYQRWPTGVYAIWYPIKDRRQIQTFHRHLIQTNIPKMLVTELCPWPDDVPIRLNGSGLIIINPPWQLDQQLLEINPVLLKLLQQHVLGQTTTRWLAT